uniref:Mevalonate kinase n=1 Tax=Romanomermis culicivorax TaxID=13658 RepID=A0A915KWP0_ROMCU
NLLAVKVTIRFKLPSCVGLGSSGAYCVCIATSLLCATGIIPCPNAQTSCADTLTWSDNHLEVIRRWSASAESLIHGRASGLDAAVCTYGGICSYKLGYPTQRLLNCPDLKVILVNSKVERSTVRMVTTVKEKLKRFPAVVDCIFNSMDAISLESVKILDKSSSTGSVCTDSANSSSSAEDEKHSMTSSEPGSMMDDYSRLNELSRINNQLLIALGVGHPKIDHICTILARYGIYPKMTGAGGGGCVFAFLKPDTPQTLVEMIHREVVASGFEMWQPMLGSDGIVLHMKRFDINVISAK